MNNIKIMIALLLTGIMLTACQQTKDDSHGTTANNTTVEIPETTMPVESPVTPTNLTVNGEVVQLAGEGFLQVGDALQDSNLILPTATFDAMVATTIKSYSGWKVIHSVPSLDTPVCTLQTKQLESAATEFNDMTFITVSADLPFALNRFCGDNAIKNMITLSDFQNNDFARNNHLLMEAYKLSARALIIVDETNTVRYVAYAPEVTSQLSIEDAINYIRQNK